MAYFMAYFQLFIEFWLVVYNCFGFLDIFTVILWAIVIRVFI